MNPKSIIFSMLTLSSFMAKSQSAVIAPPGNQGTLIAFASDTQAPMWVETLWLKSDRNRLATRKIFSDIGSLKPSSVFLLGDVVNLGYSNRQWKPMDKYLQHLRDSSIDVNAILGNHEVMGRARKGQKKFQKRFPNHVRTGYVEIRDSIAIIMLNSNFKKLTQAETDTQKAWYKSTLEKLDADPAVQYIITGCHHSPFTNSRIVKPCKEVQDQFVPLYLSSRKSRLFLSGHCHGFEHFQMGGKDFLVIGGGGGLHQPLKQGMDMIPDLAKDYKPLFHYITIRRSTQGLEVNSLCLKSDFSGFEEGMKLEIKPAADWQAVASKN